MSEPIRWVRAVTTAKMSMAKVAAPAAGFQSDFVLAHLIVSSARACHSDVQMVRLKVDFKSSDEKIGGGMKIGDLASRGGLSASAIRYYESMGILKPAQRVAGQRRYSADAVDRVLLIRFATDMGFTLNEIRLFLEGLRGDTPVGPRWTRLAKRKIREVEETIQRSQRLKLLLQHLLRCHCASLQVCVEHLSLSRDLRLVEQKAKTQGRKVPRRLS